MLHRSSYFYPLMPENDILIRFAAFFLCLLIMLVWEWLAPARPPEANNTLRRINNLALILVSVVLVQVLLPLLALMGIANMATEQSLGLLANINLPLWLEVIIAFIVLDLAIYWQHRLFHQFGILWRLHRVHHTDRHIDVTTAIRFHPIEIVLSLLFKSVIIILIGAPAIAVFIFELSLNLLPMFNHSNIRLPSAIDRWLRLLIVTPDMHRVHHSQIKRETNSNYCFCLPWWDYLFQSYRAQPEAGHQAMKIGLEEFNGSETILLHKLLQLPFRRTST